MVCYRYNMCFRIKFIYEINKELIFSYMIKQNIDITEFCERCYITIKDFSDLMKNDPYIDPIIIGKVCNCCNCKFIDILK